jgi:hypothetical protein
LGGWDLARGDVDGGIADGVAFGGPEGEAECEEEVVVLAAACGLVCVVAGVLVLPTTMPRCPTGSPSWNPLPFSAALTQAGQHVLQRVTNELNDTVIARHGQRN